MSLYSELCHISGGVTMTISGGSIQHFLVGQGVSLECRVQGPGLRSPPLALYWERGNKVRY